MVPTKSDVEVQWDGHKVYISNLYLILQHLPLPYLLQLFTFLKELQTELRRQLDPKLYPVTQALNLFPELEDLDRVEFLPDGLRVSLSTLETWVDTGARNFFELPLSVLSADDPVAAAKEYRTLKVAEATKAAKKARLDEIEKLSKELADEAEALRGEL